MQQDKEHPENKSEETSNSAYENTETANNQEAEQEVNIEINESEQLKSEIAELKDKYLRLFSEFDNYKKRTAKEKMDFFKTATEDLVSALLPVLDDFERAQKSFVNTTEINVLIEGVQLVQNKLTKALENKGLKPMDSQSGTPFDTELHEAITQFPAPTDDLKGKVIDTAEKGYYLHDKVIRFAKVIIGN